MKKQLLILIAILSFNFGFSQTGFNYKALITDNGNVLANTPIDIKFTIANAGGPGVMWVEEHAGLTTDANGIVVAIIGEGTRISGIVNSFDEISFHQPYRLLVDVNINGNGYQLLSESDLKSVPYAKYAETAGNTFSGDFNDLSNVPAGLSDGDDDTQLTEIQVDNYVSNNGYATQLNDLSDAKYEGGSLFIGQDAGANDDASNNGNTSLGHNTLYSNTSGSYNIAIGKTALYSNTTGDENLAIGNSALGQNTTGEYNISIGNGSLGSNSAGNDNIAMGNYALYANTTGYDNLAIGSTALQNNETGFHNIAIGNGTLPLGADTKYNIAIGWHALNSNGDGVTETFHANFNLGIGWQALVNNTTGSGNIGIGSHVLEHTTTGSANIAIGNYTGSENGSNNISIGHSSHHGSYGSNDIAIGINAGQNSDSSNATGENVCIGHEAGYYLGIGNVAIGGLSLRNINGDGNTAIGFSALNSNDIQYWNNATGIGAGAQVTGSNMIRLGNTSVTWIGGASAWYNTSDGNYKQNVTENVPGLDFITKLRPVTYTLNVSKLAELNSSSTDLIKNDDEASKITHSGFIAQEIEQAAQSVHYDFDGVHRPNNKKDTYSVAYAQLVVPLVKAVQEQQQTIEALKEQNRQMQKQIDQLKQLIQQKD